MGEFIRRFKHFACAQIDVPSVKCGIAALHNDSVDIILGYSASSGNPVVVYVPIDIFEQATADSIKQWVEFQNKRFAETSEDAVRTREIGILKALLAKYPESLVLAPDKEGV